MKEGLDTFFTTPTPSPMITNKSTASVTRDSQLTNKKPVSSEISSSTPVGSPLLEEIRNSSVTSSPSSGILSRSREDLRMKVRIIQKYLIFWNTQ